MFRRILSAALPLFVAFAAASAAPAQLSMADDFASQQDLATDPPRLGWSLSGLIAQVNPNGSFAQYGGGPFPLPIGAVLPGSVQDVVLHCRHGSYVSGLVPLCVTDVRLCTVDLLFLDGSRYVYVESRITTTCNGGARQESSFVHQSADIAAPGSWADVRMQQQRRRLGIQDDWKQLCVARAGAIADLRNRGGVPVVAGGSLEFEFAPGAVLDLRQNPAAGGPIFTTDSPVLLRCDTVLLDPGVQLTDLFSLPPVMLPARSFADLELVVPGYESTRTPAPLPLEALLLNTGNVDQQVAVAWSGSAAMPAQQVLSLPAGRVQRLAVAASIPGGAPVGSASLVQWQATSLAAPPLARSATTTVAHDHRGQFRYGTGTPGNAGPLSIDASAQLTAGGAPVVLATAGADAGAAGLFMFGVPLGFQYGTWMLPGFAAELYLDPFGPLFVTAFVVADSAGSARIPVAMPNNPGLRGLRLDVQALFATSVQYPYSLASTPALSMAVQ